MFNIGKNELLIYKILLRKKMRVEELGKILGKDRSTVQRSLKRLMNCGMVKRERKLLDGGGFYYVYSSIPINDLKKWLNNCIEEWYREMKEAIKNLEDIIS